MNRIDVPCWSLSQLREIAAERGTWTGNLLDDWRSEAISEFVDYLEAHLETATQIPAQVTVHHHYSGPTKVDAERLASAVHRAIRDA